MIDKILEVLYAHAVYEEEWFITLPKEIGLINVAEFLEDLPSKSIVDVRRDGCITVDKDWLRARALCGLAQDTDKLEKWYAKFKLVLMPEGEANVETR